MRYRLTLSYAGGGFCGWQHQPSGNSVQDALQAAIKSLTGEDVKVVGSGRTDAGVHAIAQVAHFDVQKELPLKTAINGINAYLPRTIRVINASRAGEDFDARKSAKKKTYMYLYYCGDATPLTEDRAFAAGALDCERMNGACIHLIGTQDFASFMASGSSAKTSVRTVYSASVERQGDFIKFFITANGFLYNMVRIIAAQLYRIGKGESVDIPKLLAARDRAVAKDVAPACGLYLYSVEYENGILL